MKNLSILFKGIFAVCLTMVLLGTSFVASAVVVAGVSIGNAAVMANGGGMFATITTAGLAAELSKFFKVHDGMPESWVYTKEVQLHKYARRITKVKGEFKAGHSVLSHVLQGFQAVWNEMGATKIKANDLTNRRCKVNFAIIPDEIEGTYLAWANEENKDAQDRSISRYIANDLGGKIMDDLNDMSINGEYDAGNLGTFGAAFDGILKVLNDIVTNTIAGGTEHPGYLIPIDALTETNMVEQVTVFEKSVPQKLRSKIKRIYMGSDRRDDYILDYEDTMGTKVTFKEGDKALTRLNRWEIVGLDNLVGSDMIFATPDENLLHLVDIFDKPQVTKVQEEDYKVKIFMDFWNGYGFYFNQMVFIAHTGSEEGLNDTTAVTDYYPEEASGSGSGS